jgi:uncharacterized integral membrane protein (TIGR00698 family)
VAGLLACVLVAGAARLAGSALQLGLETALALAFGLGLGSISAVRERALDGASFAARYALRIGITLLGARLTVGQLLATGGSAVLAIVLIVTAALLLGAWLARRLLLVPPLSALITVGMAICGNSAILALSPIIGARHRETAYAVSTITIFGLIGVLVLPIVGHVLALTDAGFGTWAGLAVNDTAQVVATGYAFSPGAGDVATVVKLTRNLAILPVLLGATWWAARQGRADARDDVTTASPVVLIGRAVPWFVVGFVIVAALRSIGLLDGPLPIGGTIAYFLSSLATLCILVALAGVGLATDIRAMLGVGIRPFLLGAVMWIVIGLLGLVLAQVYHG